MEAKGKALVTGASRGIGRATALALAQHGFEVWATMRNPADGAELVAAHERIRIVELDVTRPETIAMPDGLRVLVNNAGADDGHLPFEHDSMEDWRQVFETNLFGLAAVTQAAIPALRASGGGVIANVTSISVLAPVPFYAVYRASKAAVAALGESLRCELAPFGIRLLEVLPGPVDTDMFAASGREPRAMDFPDYREAAAFGHAGRLNVESVKASVASAAERIVAAVLDDAAPLKVTCDSMGDAMLQAWRAGTEEDYQRSFLPAFVPPVPPRS
jgi:NAD(P)-dependent dehydrogenase (short-subunit alcohol dehydrogenase family)